MESFYIYILHGDHMGFLEGVVGLLIIVIILAVFIPVTNLLLPIMIGDMGSLTGIMVSSIVVIIIVSALFIFIQQVMHRDEYQPIQGGQF
jgi:hypothetical protein